jgi:hypothetical protein
MRASEQNNKTQLSSSSSYMLTGKAAFISFGARLFHPVMRDKQTAAKTNIHYLVDKSIKRVNENQMLSVMSAGDGNTGDDAKRKYGKQVRINILITNADSVLLSVAMLILSGRQS